MGTNGEGESLENRPEAGEYDIAPEWVVRGWKMWINGIRNWSAIAREVGHDWATVKKHVTRYSHALGAMYEGKVTNPLAEYVDGNLEDLSFQMRIALKAEKAEDLRAASGSRKEVSALRKDIAGALGIVTDRKGVAMSQDPDAPPLFPPGVVDLRAVLIDADQRERLAGLADGRQRTRDSEDQPGSPGPGDDEGQVADSSPPEPAEP